jgi:23S rRNA (cytidine1920-2'-O)/16S rRNA (cytidine1409-2'-O)-methyltransferase
MRRRLDAELVRRGLARSRGDAADAIRSGRVTVSGAPASSAARLVAEGEAVYLGPAPARYVSRGGEKLAAALDAFELDVADRRVLDAGAGTGGFTDCLLQRGARRVIAVDVGHGQLAWSIREHPHVSVLERTHVRDLDVDLLAGPVDLVVADLSFISLRTAAPALLRVARPGIPFVLLLKPQFEAGRARLGKGGVVRDLATRRAIAGEVVADLAQLGLGARRAIGSPITGAAGNVEVLLLAYAGRATVTAAELDRACEGPTGHRAGHRGDGARPAGTAGATD